MRGEIPNSNNHGRTDKMFKLACVFAVVALSSAEPEPINVAWKWGEVRRERRQSSVLNITPSVPILERNSIVYES